MRWLASLAALYIGLCVILAFSSALLVPDCDRVRSVRTVGVVLGSAARGPDKLADDSRSRVDAAIDLFERGRVARLHFSGSREPETLPSVAALMRVHASEAGVPDVLMSVEEESDSTLENALYSLPALSRAERVMIVTDDYHALRGAASFAWAGHPGAICAAPNPMRTWTRRLYDLGRETAAWGFNIPRALIWSASASVGLEDELPEGFLD